MVGRRIDGLAGRRQRRLGKGFRGSSHNLGPGAFRCRRAAVPRSVVYRSAALRAVFRFRRRASAAFRALASLGFT